MIYRNSLLANHVTWTLDATPEAPEIVRTFLRSECQLLRLAAVAGRVVDEVEDFLKSHATMSVHRFAAGDVLVSTAGDELLITGKTAEVLSAYIDREIVRTEDRLDMTLRRVVGL